MISGTYVLTDTINGSFNSLYTADLQGHRRLYHRPSRSSRTTRQNGTAAELPGSRSWPRSRPSRTSAPPSGGVSGDPARSSARTARSSSTAAPPTSASASIPTIPEFNTLTLVSGSWPKHDEVVIDQAAAKKAGYKAGDMIGILANGPVQKMRLSGIVNSARSNGILGATLAGFDLATAQQLFDKKGKLDAIQAVGQARRLARSARTGAAGRSAGACMSGPVRRRPRSSPRTPRPASRPSTTSCSPSPASRSSSAAS